MLIYSNFREENIAWIVTALLFILGLYCFFLMQKKHRQEINRIKAEESQKAEEQIRIAREECSRQIEHEKAVCAEQVRTLREYIEKEKSEILKKNEKEILADITVSMSGFATRIERIESKLLPMEQNMELLVDKVDNIGVTVSDIQFIIQPQTGESS